MLTYQVRQRVFRLDRPVRFPNQAEIRFCFAPRHPFGATTGGFGKLMSFFRRSEPLGRSDIYGHTAIRAMAATMYFDANSGHHHVVSKERLIPIAVAIDDGPTRRVRWSGNELVVSDEFADVSSLRKFVESLYYGYPLLVSIQFFDPVVIERVAGEVGGVPFRWELVDWRMPLETTTQKDQEQKIMQSWFRLESLSGSKGRRLLAALHYFHVASRLARVGNTPWEFMPEIILNYSKALEALFPPGKRDDVRAALKKLEYTDEAIEKYFVPAMALRNEIDVGHVKLTLFKLKDLRVLWRYTEEAERMFRDLLRRVCFRAQAGFADIPPHDIGKPDVKVSAVLRRLHSFYGPEK